MSGHVVIIAHRNGDGFADDGIVPDFRIAEIVQCKMADSNRKIIQENHILSDAHYIMGRGREEARVMAGGERGEMDG